MRQVILLFALLASLSLSAQEDFQIVKGNCLPDLEGGGSHRALGRYKLQTPRKDWDATKTYKQLVILVEFADLSFAEAHDKAFYEKVFAYLRDGRQIGFADLCELIIKYSLEKYNK